MKIFIQLGKFTTIILIVSLLLIIYGYTCRLIGLYFFWESTSIGWPLLFISIISFLVNRIKIKSKEKKKTLFEKIVIGIFSFILLVQIIITTILPFTDAYSAAKSYLQNDSKLKSEIGNITGFSIRSLGSIQMSSTNGQESGNAQINLIVKGDKAFRDVRIYLIKNIDSDEWVVYGLE